MDFNPEYCYNLLKHQLCFESEFLTCDMSSSQAASASLLASFLKKWMPADPSSLERVALDAFISSNQHCRSVVLPTDGDYDLEIFKDAKCTLDAQFHSGPLQSPVLNLHSALNAGRAGPGASCSTRHTDFYQKMFAGPLSTTQKGLYEYYVRNISSSWLDAESKRRSIFPLVVVEGSNLSTVPKNRKTNRTICTEPSLNMFFQLGAGHVIEGLLRAYHNIDMSLQPDINKAFARRGSLDGEFATIDLSNASDTISRQLVAYLLPRDVLSTLDNIRSPSTRIAGEYHELYMMSSMGNGFTFPLQTLIFATLVRSTYKFMGITPCSYGPNRNYSVFGDDIIVCRKAYHSVVRILNKAGFFVNEEKSFNEGAFRESCGGDFFKGVDVRGVYLKKVNDEQDIYSVFNRLARWSIKHHLDISLCLNYLKGLAKFQPVPFDCSDTAGFKCPTDHLSHSKFDCNGSRFYWASTAVPRRVTISPEGDSYNASGAFISHVGGYMREHRLTLRSRNVRWKVVRCKTPSWDFIPYPGLTIRDYNHLYWSLNSQ